MNKIARKPLSIFITFVMVILNIILPLSNTTFADDEELFELIYKDWAFNDDFSKVTISGKTYDNYIVVKRFDNELVMMNMWSIYLTNPYLQTEMTPDAYATKAKKSVYSMISGTMQYYPRGELLTINGLPWQQSEFKEDYLFYLDLYFSGFSLSNGVDKENFFAMINDSSYNGIQNKLFINGMSKEEAWSNTDLSNMKVTTGNYDILKNYDQFKKVSGGKVFLFEELSFKNLSELNFKMTKATVVKPDIPIISEDNSIVLFLNNLVMTVATESGNKKITLDTVPIASNGTTLVPIKAITEAFGANVDWKRNENKVTIKKDKTLIELTIGSNIAIVNGAEVQMKEPAQISKNRTMVPLKFLSEQMGFKVDWDKKLSKITITK